ncbi:hypothetical protein ID0154_09370 [Helicobacter pylori]
MRLAMKSHDLKTQKERLLKALQLRVLVLTALLIKSKADYLLGLSRRLDLLKTLFLKTLLKKNENY